MAAVSFVSHLFDLFLGSLYERFKSQILIFELGLIVCISVVYGLIVYGLIVYSLIIYDLVLYGSIRCCLFHIISLLISL